MASGSNFDEEEGDIGDIKILETPLHFRNFYGLCRASLADLSKFGLRTKATEKTQAHNDHLSLVWSENFTQTYRVDARTLAMLTTVKSNCITKFEVELDPAMFHLDGAQIIFVDLNVVSDFWINSLETKVASSYYKYPFCSCPLPLSSALFFSLKSVLSLQLQCPGCKKFSLTSGGWAPTLRRVAYGGGNFGSYGPCYVSQQRFRCEGCPNAKGEFSSRGWSVRRPLRSSPGQRNAHLMPRLFLPPHH